MTPFLNIVAKDLYEKTGGDMSRVTVVFPNKRASLFFNKALAALSDKPMWSPQYVTISDLFRQYATAETGDRIQLVCELYLIYKEITRSEEPLDRFYGWGELILSDFDDIDKHLADARKIFSLLSDIHELDGVEYLTERQQQALQCFFSNFSKEHTTELKRRFLQLWNRFGDIYTAFRQRLTDEGIAYEGMLYRDVIENIIRKGKATVDEGMTYVFVGFNLLHEAEMEMFSFFQKNTHTMFYWDYDVYYMRNHEAGKYISQYLKYYPNELPADSEAYHNLGKQKDITIISSPTEDLQARYIAQWLTPERIAAGRRTAIVLANEDLLETVIHCLPPAVKSVNITTGYPLEKSPIASLVRLMVILLQRKSHTLHNVNAVLHHPFAKYISPMTAELYERLNKATIYYPTLDDLSIDENTRLLFTPLDNRKDSRDINARLMWMIKTIAHNIPETAEMEREALFRMHNILNRLATLAPDGWDMTLYQGLLQQVIQTTTIPFHGEPIEGLQIMGVLETRNLDFDHLLLLSCNEGNLPAKINDTSFIPHSVRVGYGLTTVDNKVAIYAYYFHRLLQRTSDAHLLYNTSGNVGRSGEMSRFMLQLIAEGPVSINRKALMAGQESREYVKSEKEKTDEVIDLILKREFFSPSALGSYLRCPLRFYYRYVAGIKDDTEGDEEELDLRVFGLIFHKAAEMIYAPLKGRTVTAEYIDSLLKEKHNMTLQRLVDAAFRTELFKLKDDARNTPRLNGLQAINREMVLTFLRNLLEYDKKHAPFTILATEEKVADTIQVTANGKTLDIPIGGFIDRLDTYTDESGIKRVRVIDYKTSRLSNAINIGSIEDVFAQPVKDHSDYYLQALMYSSIIRKKQSLPIAPNLFYVQQLNNGKIPTELRINKQPIMDAAEYLAEYNDRLKALISTILDKQSPFTPLTDGKQCDTCPYAAFCS